MTEEKKTTRANVTKMSDIARIVGVSKSTVSRALANNPLINEKTRLRIQEVAKEHNYRLNAQARNFFLKDRLTIAALIQTEQHVSDPFLLELLAGISESLDERGHELLLVKASKASKDWLEEFVASRRCDGLILLGQGKRHEQVRDLLNGVIPYVVWGDCIPDIGYKTVGSNNFLGGKLATEHLIQHGRKHIAFLGDPDLPEAHMRHAGYLAAMNNAGIENDPQLLRLADLTTESAFYAVNQLIDSDLKFDAIFSASDLMAICAINALKKKNVRVPEDVAVVGYDNLLLASYIDPALTTITLDPVLGSKAIVDVMISLVDGEETTSTVLDTYLIIRKSCGC